MSAVPGHADLPSLRAGLTRYGGWWGRVEEGEVVTTSSFFNFFIFYSKTLQGNPLVFRRIHVIYNYISEIHTFSQKTAANFQNF